MPTALVRRAPSISTSYAFQRPLSSASSRWALPCGLDIGLTLMTLTTQLQEKKRALAAAALSGDKLKNMRLGIDDLVALFRSSGHDEDDD